MAQLFTSDTLRKKVAEKHRFAYVLSNTFQIRVTDVTKPDFSPGLN